MLANTTSYHPLIYLLQITLIYTKNDSMNPQNKCNARFFILSRFFIFHVHFFFHPNNLSVMLISSVGFHGHSSKEPALTNFLPLIILCAFNRAIHSPCIHYTKANVRGIFTLKYFNTMSSKFGPLIFQDTGLLVTTEGIFSWENFTLFKQGGLAAP